MLSSPRPLPSWKPPSFRRTGVSRARLVTRGPMDCLDAGPNFIQSSQEIINMIISRRTVKKLILNHNALGDDGCVVLFNFLCSDVGRTSKISDIRLMKNGIGDRGLLAIAEYLKGNKALKELHLENNVFQGTPSVASAFAAALNTSHLEKLFLNSNRQLSDSFSIVFFPILNTPHLRELALSTAGLTFLSVPAISSYMSSSRCRLHNLSLNGNALGLSGVTDLTRTLKDCNLGLQKVELSWNQAGVYGEVEAWKKNTEELQRSLIRNQYLKTQKEKEALELLVAARATLLPPKYQREAHPHSISLSHIRPGSLSLPTELQLHILSFLAPHLSSAQRIRIYTFASTFDTLPPLLPHISINNDSKCPPDLPYSGAYRKVGCLDGCIRGVVCQREEKRERWLKVVGCDIYEREPEGD